MDEQLSNRTTPFILIFVCIILLSCFPLFIIWTSTGEAEGGDENWTFYRWKTVRDNQADYFQDGLERCILGTILISAAIYILFFFGNRWRQRKKLLNLTKKQTLITVSTLILLLLAGWGGRLYVLWVFGYELMLFENCYWFS